MPGFPGAACRSSRRGLWLSFQASACSRPPEPTTRTFTRRVYSRNRRELLDESAAGFLVAGGQVEGVCVGAPVGGGEHDPGAPQGTSLGLGRLDERAADAAP